MALSTRSSLDKELAALDAEVRTMAAVVAEGIGAAGEALALGDHDLAVRVREGLADLGRGARACESRAYAILARQQPVGSDLRFVVTAARLTLELERSAQLVSHVADFAARPHGALPPKTSGLVARMADEARRLFLGAMESYDERDVDRAEALEVWDDRMDELHRELLDELFTTPLGLRTTLELALVGRYLERIGDHAVTIGRRVCYLVKGELFDAAAGEVLAKGRSQFHQRIASLQGAALAIGHEVQRSIAEATEAWLRRDGRAGAAIDSRTAGWSARARDVEFTAYELIAIHQPMALDLRQIAALVRLAEAVSRSGDLVAHIARSACFEREVDAFSPVLRTLVVEMATATAGLFGEALAAYGAEEADRSAPTDEGGEQLDLLRGELFANLLQGDVRVAPAIDLALLVRFYERLGAHAEEIARRSNYVLTGGAPAS